jgi:hypothetical protein
MVGMASTMPMSRRHGFGRDGPGLEIDCAQAESGQRHRCRCARPTRRPRERRDNGERVSQSRCHQLRAQQSRRPRLSNSSTSDGKRTGVIGVIHERTHLTDRDIINIHLSSHAQGSGWPECKMSRSPLIQCSLFPPLRLPSSAGTYLPTFSLSLLTLVIKAAPEYRGMASGF